MSGEHLLWEIWKVNMLKLNQSIGDFDVRGMWLICHLLWYKQDQRSTSPYHATAWSNIQVTRIKVMITKEKNFLIKANSPNYYREKYVEKGEKNVHFDR